MKRKGRRPARARFLSFPTFGNVVINAYLSVKLIFFINYKPKKVRTRQKIWNMLPVLRSHDKLASAFIVCIYRINLLVHV